MGKLWDTYNRVDETGYCQIHFDSKNEMFYIKYFDENNRMFFTEEFPNKSIHYVRDAAANWVAGIKKIDMLYG
jgi:hypothetical protein